MLKSVTTTIQAMLGRKWRVIFEKPKDEIWPGYTRNYIRVIAKHTENIDKKLARGRLDKACADFVGGHDFE